MSELGVAGAYGRHIKDAVKTIAHRGIMDRRGGVLGTRKIWGYVCAVHGPDDENEELRNTVDVQEYGHYVEDKHVPSGMYPGHHEGVLISAIQDNNNGYMIVPQLYSDVVITKDSVDLKEYIVMYSHAELIRLRSSRDLEIGVVETKDFDEDDDGAPDVDDLEETGTFAKTVYVKDKIATKVTTKDGGFTDETTPTKRELKVGNTTIYIDGDKVTVETSSEVNVKTKTANLESTNANIKSTNVKVESTNTEVQSTNTKVKSTSTEVEGSSVKVKGANVEITGGTLTVKGTATTDMLGPFNAIKTCPYISGAPHSGSIVGGT